MDYPVFTVSNFTENIICYKVFFLAHQIRTSEILLWDRKSDLTHVIFARLSREGSTLVVLELTHMVVKWRHCYVKVTSSYHDASQRIAFFKI